MPTHSIDESLCKKAEDWLEKQAEPGLPAGVKDLQLLTGPRMTDTLHGLADASSGPLIQSGDAKPIGIGAGLGALLGGGAMASGRGIANLFRD